MSKLETKEAVEILLSEKKKAGYKLAKAYDSYCLLPNEHDKEDWDNYSALVTALEMALEALEKQIPMKIRIEREHPIYGYASFCPNCNRMDVGGWSYCPDCGQAIAME